MLAQVGCRSHALPSRVDAPGARSASISVSVGIASFVTFVAPVLLTWRPTKINDRIKQLDERLEVEIENLSGKTHPNEKDRGLKTPRGSVFSVGGSDPVVASDPGRSDTEGFRLWIGTRPQGMTTVEISNLPDYLPAQRQVILPNSSDRK